MPPIERGFLVLFCATLFSCAAAPDFEPAFDDQPDAFAPALAGPQSDAGALALVDSAVAPIVIPAIPVVGSSASALSGWDAGSSNADASVRLLDAGRTLAPDAAATGPSPAIPDASSSVPARDASVGGSQGGGAALCNPASCNNECALLARCCNVANECACQDLFSGLCILPSL